MPDYVPDHHRKGERERLALMSQLLDPLHRELDDSSIDASLAHCADPGWWTQTIAFTAVHGRATA
jgi:hypothetical protein